MLSVSTILLHISIDGMRLKQGKCSEMCQYPTAFSDTQILLPFSQNDLLKSIKFQLYLNIDFLNQ
jgi:hypothetical protein